MVICSEITGISLCSGGGGLELGISIVLPTYRTVGFCEREAYAASALVARMEDQTLGQAPIWDDLGTFDGLPWRGRVDIISAGYPCQPFSSAGKRQGEDDDRHLWPHVSRIVAEVQPALVFIENVDDHLSLGFDRVGADLQALGYRIEAGVFSAAETRAPHIRERLFALAAVGDSLLREPVVSGSSAARFRMQLPTDRGVAQDVADTNRTGFTERRRGTSTGSKEFPQPQRPVRWPIEPDMGRVVDGLAEELDQRRDRLRILGNGVVPITAAFAFVKLARDLGLTP